MDSQQQNLDDQVVVDDDDEVPPRYRVERHSSELSRTRGRAPSRNALDETTEVLNPPKLHQLMNLLDERKQKQKVETQLGIQESQERDCNADQTQVSQHQMIELQRQFQDILQGKEFEWIAREKDLHRQINQVQQYAAERDQMFQAKIHDIQLEKSALEAQHIAFIRKQQEATFRQMESARWLPEDETKVMSDLDKLKRDMRSWAKSSSIKDISALQSLGKVECAAVMQQLSNVVVLENGQLPEGILTTAKSPMLLLNALLTDHVYMSFFRSPFFFLEERFENSSSNGRPEVVLEDIYQRAKSANPQDAHIWRSQTLRLLMPPLLNDISDGEKKLHYITEEAIAKVAQQQATDFLAGPASFLVKNNTKLDVGHKLTKLYDVAARQSYMLWTRRTEMRCYTLRDIEQPDFDAESSFFDPDTLMRYEDHEDQLKGRPITVLVHPLLEVAGTVEAKDYDQERVWVKGVVWLDSKMT